MRKRRNGDQNNDNSRCREASIMTPALGTAHATARSLGRQPRVRGSGRGGRAKRKIWHGLDRTSLLLLGSTSNLASHREELCFILSWYAIVGFLAGCVAKALLHTHLSIMWTIILGIVGSIIGGAVTHLFYPPSAGSISPRRFNCFHTRRNLGPFSLAQVSPASAARLN